ncbi:hypothetical protein FSP39_001309 [Pinctada imbricata]|uniref:A-kinase anchor protein 17A n=1 Tax=Pinctada imbricata TaxID=66713 RepID=A0AA88Y6A3_PINIB|nr:hypothetical protein FSP39_001309 [Pinctada imbricata]
MAANTTVCNDTSEAVELFKSQGLYLKPIARLNVCVQLPKLKEPGKSISNWEVMEKIKSMAKATFIPVLKIIKSTMEFIRLEGEADNKSLIKTLIQILEGKTIKLSGFPELLKVKAGDAKINFPSQHDWDSFFRDAKNMDEMKAGERPDTIHLKDLPTRWFASKHSDKDQPCEHLVRRIFETYGEVRCIDIPMLDHYRKEMISSKTGNMQTFSFSSNLTFEAFVQYKEYIGFVNAMNSLRAMKLLYIPNEEGEKAYTALVKVDFDKSKHLSDRSIKKRRLEREKLEQLEREREEKVRKEREEEERKIMEERRKKEEEEREKERKKQEKIERRERRRKEREEKRRQKALERKKLEEEKKYQLKIQMEERRFLIAQRKLESIRLLGELFARVKESKREESERERLRRVMKGGKSKLRSAAVIPKEVPKPPPSERDLLAAEMTKNPLDWRKRGEEWIAEEYQAKVLPKHQRHKNVKGFPFHDSPNFKSSARFKGKVKYTPHTEWKKRLKLKEQEMRRWKEWSEWKKQFLYWKSKYAAPIPFME